YVHLPGYRTRTMLPFHRPSMKRKILLVFLGISLVFTGLAIYASWQVRATPDERILPDLQNIHVGSVFPALPGVKDVFVVAQCEREHSLVLSWRLPNGQHQTTWAYILDEPQRGQTRLIVRGRVASGYRPFGLPEWFATRVGPVAHLVMQRKQLLGIARRAESSPRITEPPEAVR